MLPYHGFGLAALNFAWPFGAAFPFALTDLDSRAAASPWRAPLTGDQQNAANLHARAALRIGSHYPRQTLSCSCSDGRGICRLRFVRGSGFNRMPLFSCSSTGMRMPVLQLGA